MSKLVFSFVAFESRVVASGLKVFSYGIPSCVAQWLKTASRHGVAAHPNFAHSAEKKSSRVIPSTPVGIWPTPFREDRASGGDTMVLRLLQLQAAAVSFEPSVH